MLDATFLIRGYGKLRRRQLAKRDPRAAQERQLFSLLRKASDTLFGREHGFSAIRTIADFQTAVPLRRYEDLWRDYWAPAFPKVTDVSWPGPIPFFALTSGTTTGSNKYIPCTHEMVRANQWATAELFAHHLAHCPRSRLWGGANFMLGGSTAMTESAPGVLEGDLSAIASLTMPCWARPRAFPPREIDSLPDWEQKIRRAAPESLKADIRSISGVPSWILLFFDQLAELRPDLPRRVADWYPNLDLLVHGGCSFAPYRRTFAELLEGSHAETREVYPASEGFIAVADRGDGEGMRMILDNGLFFEFVPLAELGGDRPTRHWVGDVETDVEYALVLSSCAGLWSYVIGDTVKLVDRDPPRLLITGRTSYSLNAFGEHLIGAEIEDAVAAAAEAIGARVGDYSVGAVIPATTRERGGHVYVVEFAGDWPAPGAIGHFAEVLDGILLDGNGDYGAHRSGGFGMAAPKIEPVPPGTFAAWMKSRGKFGGQNKVPRIINDADLFDGLRRFRA